MQRLGLKMYRPRLLHGLLGDEPDRRLQFCEVALNDERQGNGIVDKITWSDETHFKLSVAVIRHNCVYYSTKNPPITIEGQLNQPGIRVWAGLSCKEELGPIFSIQLLHTTCILTCWGTLFYHNYRDSMIRMTSAFNKTELLHTMPGQCISFLMNNYQTGG